MRDCARASPPLRQGSEERNACNGDGLHSILLCRTIAVLMAESEGELYDAEATIGQLGWPGRLSSEQLTASLFARAARVGLRDPAERILARVFEQTDFPAFATRDDRLTVARFSLCRLAAFFGMLDDLRFRGPEDIALDKVVESDEWNASTPKLPSVRGPHGAGSV